MALARTSSAAAGIVILLAVPITDASPARSADGFSARSSKISSSLKERMKGKSWHKGCPVPIRRLRLIRVSYHGFDGETHTGRLVAHKDAVDALTSSLRAMYEAGFKIRRMYLVDRYDGSDHKSMRADNTSAFNCRTVAGTDTWSQHAYGRAIDVNPVENPYVSGDHVSPEGASVRRPLTTRQGNDPPTRRDREGVQEGGVGLGRLGGAD